MFARHSLLKGVRYVTFTVLFFCHLHHYPPNPPRTHIILVNVFFFFFPNKFLSFSRNLETFYTRKKLFSASIIKSYKLTGQYIDLVVIWKKKNPSGNKWSATVECVRFKVVQAAYQSCIHVLHVLTRKWTTPRQNDVSNHVIRALVSDEHQSKAPRR